MLNRSSKLTEKLKTLALSGALVAVMAIAGGLTNPGANAPLTVDSLDRAGITYATVLR